MIEGKLIHFDPLLLLPWQEEFIKNYEKRHESKNGITAGCFVYVFNADGTLKHRCFHSFGPYRYQEALA